VKTAFDWGQRRAQVLAALQSVMGPLPDPSQRAPLEVRVVSETATGAYLRKKITYQSDSSSRVSAYLLVPDAVRRGAPAMICLHDDAPAGKDGPAGLDARDSMRYADELARRGYVCLVPDYPSFGESYDFQEHGYASGAMKAVWDNVRGIDLLETLPEAGPRRIGIIGHGLGGQNALLTAALDCRIAAVVSSCGFTTFARYRGGDLTDWADPRMMPRIRDVAKGDPAKVPFDFGELLGTLVPRPVFLLAPLGDEVMDVEGVKSAVGDASAVYELRRAPGALQAVYPDGGRIFPEPMRTQAYAWLDRRLKR
jgi:dienelactone hydrolase